LKSHLRLHSSGRRGSLAGVVRQSRSYLGKKSGGTMRMFLGFLERIGFFRFLQDHVLFIAIWGSTVMIMVIVLSAAGIWLLGRNGRLLVPKTGLGRLSSILLLFVVTLSSWGLFLLKGAMSPVSRLVLQMD